MAIRDIVLYPDRVLSKRAAPFETIGPQVGKLAAAMFETMQTFDGCGLAGPQIGVSRRIFVLHEPEKDLAMCLVNPEILAVDGQESREEGCLSLPRIYAPVTRAAQIQVRAFNERGKPLNLEVTGLLARIIQHETDHLDGVIFLDRVDILTREAKLQEWDAVRQQLAVPVNAR